MINSGIDTTWSMPGQAKKLLLKFSWNYWGEKVISELNSKDM